MANNVLVAEVDSVSLSRLIRAFQTHRTAARVTCISTTDDFRRRRGPVSTEVAAIETDVRTVIKGTL